MNKRNLLLTFVLAFFFTQVFAGTSTWTGATSNDWTVAGNWTGGVPSGSSDVVVFPAGASNMNIINVPTITIKRLTVTGGTYSLNNTVSAVTLTCAAGGAGSELIISAGAYLTIFPNVTLVTGTFPVDISGVFTVYGNVTFGGSLAIAGTLHLKSTPSGSASLIDNGTITYIGTGSVIVERYLVPDQWHAYCIPLTQVTTLPFKDYYMKYYDEQTNHNYKYVIDPALDSTLNSDGLGYMMWSSSATTNTTPVSVAGALNTGTITVNATRTQGYIPWTSPPGTDFDGWNLIGNPYVSAIDLDLLTYTNVGTSIWFWDPGFGNYTVYPAGGFPYGTHASDKAAASQAFFVKANAAVGSVQFTNAARLHSTEPFLKEGGTDYLKVKVITAVNAFSDQASIHFTENATAGYDTDIDAEKLPGEADAPQLYFPVSNEKQLTINVIPWDEGVVTVPVNFTLAQAGSCELSFDGLGSFNTGTQIYLEDRTNGYMQDLSANGKYQFSSSPYDDPSRFLLHFTKSTIGFNEAEKEVFTIYSYGDRIYVKSRENVSLNSGTVEVIDLLGRVVFRAPLDNSVVNTYEVNLQSGYYVVTVKTPGTVTNKKIYLQ